MPIFMMSRAGRMFMIMDMHNLQSGGVSILLDLLVRTDVECECIAYLGDLEWMGNRLLTCRMAQ